MAVKFSQFLAESLTSPSFLVGYNSSTNQNVKVSYADLLAALGGGGIGGSGTTNYISKWTGANSLGNSQIFDNGTSVGIGTATPTSSFEVKKSPGGYLPMALFESVGTSATEYTIAKFIGSVSNSVNLLSNSRIDYQQKTNGNDNYFNQYFLNANGGQAARISVRYPGHAPFNADGQLHFATNNGGSAPITNMVIFQSGNIVMQNGGTYADAGYKLDVVGADARINGLRLGRGAGNSISSVAFGQDAGANGSGNTSIGLYAGKGITGVDNTFVGASVGEQSGTGNRNTGIGAASLYSLNGGNNNTSLGYFSALSLTSGSYNILIGSGDKSITTGSFNTIIGSQITGLSSSLSNTIILADGQGNIRQYIDSTGNVGIGTTSPAYKLDVSGTGNYSNNLSITGGTSSPTAGVNGLHLFFNSNVGYISAAQQGTGPRTLNLQGRPIIFTNNNSGVEYGRFSSSDNFLIGTTTDAGYKLDVNGTARVQGLLEVVNSTSSTVSKITNGQLLLDGAQTTSSKLYVKGGVLLETGNGTSYLSIKYNAAGGLPNTDTYFNLSWNYPNGRGNAFLTYLNTLGTDPGFTIYSWNNTTLTERAHFNDTGLKVTGNIESTTSAYFATSSGNVGIGTTAPNASSILHLSSTTKGFLPPRMTGAQAEAIASPAVGLMVFSTDGSGTTITSSGWWGYTSAGWVKIN